MLEALQQINLLFIPFFLAGVILLVIEMYTPGFGVAGISGLVCFIASVVVGAKNFLQACVLTVMVLVAVGVIIIAFIILISAGKLPTPLILKNSAKKAEGFVSGKDFSFLIGKAAVAKTALRPAGKAEVDGVVYDVVSEGEFIDCGAQIIICGADSNRITVKRR